MNHIMCCDVSTFCPNITFGFKLIVLLNVKHRSTANRIALFYNHHRYTKINKYFITISSF